MPSSPEMQAERGFLRDGSSSHRYYSEGLLSDGLVRANGDSVATIPTSSSSSSSYARCSSPSPPSSSSSNGLNYIEHRVTKMDTLAGVAIKYGVEVADIRRMNGLVTDLQMFALKSLHIPLPGRHPPSPVVSNGSAVNGDQTPPRRPHDDVLDSLQSLKLKPPRRVSPAMSSLQGYYGLTPPKKGPVIEGTEMAVYKTGRALYLEDEPLPRESPLTDPLLSKHRKSRSLISLVNGLSLENGEMITKEKTVAEATDNSEAERYIRRRQKADADSSLHTPEILMKEDSSGGFSGITGKGLALRPKLGSRTDVDAARQNSIPLGDSFLADVLVSVRKSSSTSNLQESENGPSLWPTGKWSLKPEAITRPIFDGLPKPITGRRNKAALD